MTYVAKKQKHDYLLELIQAGNTGSADKLCARICVSRATLKRYLQDLRQLNYIIRYCNKTQTYYLVEPD